RCKLKFGSRSRLPRAGSAERVTIAEVACLCIKAGPPRPLHAFIASPYPPFAPIRVSVGHYENLPVASRLVPARLRPAVVAIYRFARAADDLADEGDAAPAERPAALAAFADALAPIGRGETPRDAPLPDLAAAIRRHRLPLILFHDL